MSTRRTDSLGRSPRTAAIALVPLAAVCLYALGTAPWAAGGEAGRRVLAVSVDGEIDIGRSDLVRRAARRAEKEKPDLLLLVIDSPGGRIDYMEKILRSIEEARLEGVSTAAWIKGNAWSAAAIIAIACDKVYMSPTASLGAAAPIFVTEKGIQMAGEKFVSAMRTEARAMAERTGRPAVIAEAMVDEDVEVFEVSVQGQRKFVSGQEWEDLRARSYREGFEAQLERTVNPAGKLLSLTAAQAVEVGMCDAVASTEAQVLDRAELAGAVVVPITMTWSQHLANFLSSPIVAALLFMAGIAGLYAEFKTPGFGLPGIIGISALALFLFGKYSVGLAEAHEILLFAAGIALLAVELFVLPGFGAAGVTGILLILAGFFLASQDFILPKTPEQVADMRANAISSSLTLIATMGLLALLANLLPRSPWFKRMELRAPITSAPQTGAAVGGLPPGLEGRRGIAETPLRPSGKARFDDLLLDVVSDGDFVELGAELVIAKVDGYRVVVSRTGGPKGLDGPLS